MPDLITHVAVAHLVCRPFELSKRLGPGPHSRILFYLGAMWPDLLSRPWYILFPKLGDWVLAFHTPAGMVFFCCLFSLLFRPDLRKKVFVFSLAGAALHFGMDCLQKQVVPGNFWLFPLSWKSFTVGYFWADDAIPFIPAWIGLVAILEGVAFWHRKRASLKQEPA
jgi:hypothetical protein